MLLTHATEAQGSDARPAVAARLEAAIFDFDGTLVDTMPLHFEAYRLTLLEHGVVLEKAAFDAAVGGRASETIPKLLGGRTDVDPGAVHRRKKELLEEVIESRPLPRLRTARLLPLLSGRVPMAIASSGSRPGLERMIERLGWGRHFAALVTGEDVTRGKPDPEAFLLAAARLDVDPRRCLAFEDTDAGVEAAERAGMTVVDVRER